MAQRTVVFYPALRRFYRKAFANRSPEVLIDVGANRGQSIVFFCRLFPCWRQIHAFEPNPALQEELKQRFAQLPLQVHGEALSNHPGIGLFHEHVLDETSSLGTGVGAENPLKNKILRLGDHSGIRKSYPVSLQTLDGFMQSHKLSHVSVLKIDVEGHEAQVLEGAREGLKAQRFYLVQLELHGGPGYAERKQQLESCLHSAGYRQVFRKRHGFGHFYELVYAPTPAANATAGG